MLPNLADDRVVGLTPGDVAALALDLAGHFPTPFPVEDAELPCHNMTDNLAERLTRADVNTERSSLQLCGRFSVVLNGHAVDAAMPGRRGRLLVAMLAVHRPHPVERDVLIDGLWPATAPDATAAALTVLLSRCRSVLGRDTLTGRSSIALHLPPGTSVDVERALEAVHDAESAAAQHQWTRAWPAALTAAFITRRRFLPEADAPWAGEWRHRLTLVQQRALTYYAEACLGIGGTELGGAERAARQLIQLEPINETGYRLLMRTQAAQGDIAAALITHDRLRSVLREELGVSPGPLTQQVLAQLLT